MTPASYTCVHFYSHLSILMKARELPWWFSGKESACQCRRCRFDPTPVLLPGEPHGQRSLEGCSPWGLRVRHDLVTQQQQQPEPALYIPRVSLAAAAAAKSLQSCPTLCDPIDSSPSGSPVPGILQARTLEWVAISFSSA